MLIHKTWHTVSGLGSYLKLIFSKEINVNLLDCGNSSIALVLYYFLEIYPTIELMCFLSRDL